MTRVLLASIHDVSPRFESEIDALIETLSAHVGDRLAMLVVPNHWGDAPIVAGAALSTRFRAGGGAGGEMFFHGFFHRDVGGHPTATHRIPPRGLTASGGEILCFFPPRGPQRG